MDEPARVLLDMDPGEPDLLLPALVALDFQVPAHGKRLVVLRDLVRFVKIGIEVVLARELGFGNNLAVQRLCDLHGELDRPLVQGRHGAREAEADGADMGVGTVAPVIGGAPAEELALRVQLAVHLKTDNDLVFCIRHLSSPPARMRMQHQPHARPQTSCP